ncbi:hypothetical protein KC361_g161 [Hortaea werneckii]|nr:hypothetical protein KC361_g161 [Hortaea werneckii]
MSQTERQSAAGEFKIWHIMDRKRALPLMMKGHSAVYELLDQQRRCEPKAGPPEKKVYWDGISWPAVDEVESSPVLLVSASLPAGGPDHSVTMHRRTHRLVILGRWLGGGMSAEVERDLNGLRLKATSGNLMHYAGQEARLTGVLQANSEGLESFLPMLHEVLFSSPKANDSGTDSPLLSLGRYLDRCFKRRRDGSYEIRTFTSDFPPSDLLLTSMGMVMIPGNITDERIITVPIIKVILMPVSPIVVILPVRASLLQRVLVKRNLLG